jgi:hypothetical protein
LCDFAPEPSEKSQVRPVGTRSALPQSPDHVMKYERVYCARFNALHSIVCALAPGNPKSGSSSAKRRARGVRCPRTPPSRCLSASRPCRRPVGGLWRPRSGADAGSDARRAVNRRRSPPAVACAPRRLAAPAPALETRARVVQIDREGYALLARRLGGRRQLYAARRHGTRLHSPRWL